jgi:hypothetical protein
MSNLAWTRRGKAIRWGKRADMNGEFLIIMLAMIMGGPLFVIFGWRWGSPKMVAVGISAIGLTFFCCALCSIAGYNRAKIEELNYGR